MTDKKTISYWDQDKQLLVTEISGDIEEADVNNWKQGLADCIALIPDNSVFKIWVNLYGFKASNFEVHKLFRSVIPLTLSKFQWRVGYLNLFPEADGLELSSERGIRCVGAAHCHQDETKIRLYQSEYSSPLEHYFTNPVLGYQWIEALPLHQ
ncbi:MAG: hypothetical protein GXC72_07075 [Chitinophagaceae bacterium]|nr:hypothetical protein [Chitinophagaceae bacterium]